MMEDLKEIITQAIKNYPALKPELIDTFYLAQAEVKEGGSIEHEYELAVEHVKELTDQEPTPSLMGEVQMYMRQFESMDLDKNTLREVTKNILKCFRLNDDPEKDIESFLHGIFTCGNWENFKNKKGRD